MSVIFSSHIENVVIPSTRNTVVVTHEMYPTPPIEGIHVPWQKYRLYYSQYETDQLIIIGLNRMITPQNRCDTVNGYLQTMTPKVSKTVIDSTPFIGEPWRLWYHYSVAFGEWMGVNYSYPIEGEWQKWFYREVNECRFSGNNIRLFIKDTVSDLTVLQTEFQLYAPSPEDIAWYHEAKLSIFAKYDTPKLLINGLLKLSNNRYRQSIDFDSFRTNKQFELPDIGIYRFIKEENERRMSIYNQFTNEALRR